MAGSASDARRYAENRGSVEERIKASASGRIAYDVGDRLVFVRTFRNADDNSARRPLQVFQLLVDTKRPLVKIARPHRCENGLVAGVDIDRRIQREDRCVRVVRRKSNTEN